MTMEPDLSSEEKLAQHLERRARELGLPSDPKAYQDGGMVVAAMGINLAEAEMQATVLKNRGIPAWVDAPGAALTVYSSPMISVVVPAGRLADATAVLAELQPPDQEGDAKVTPGTWPLHWVRGVVIVAILGGTAVAVIDACLSPDTADVGRGLSVMLSGSAVLTLGLLAIGFLITLVRQPNDKPTDL
jgi:hypothetical protein